ncbi:Uncharacterized protein TCM_038147 [Theobroma cacao]|uniref:Uncharacterized protein n=1 Tax=Theobroma cacao TaxID=3641 RepID=A0A061GPX0_THECC|nr:Uncharacterized protein TCM_038147 [Theobroma cacao]
MIKDADSMGPEVAAGRWMMGGVLKIGKYSFADQTRMGWEREVLSLSFETRRKVLHGDDEWAGFICGVQSDSAAISGLIVIRLPCEKLLT